MILKNLLDIFEMYIANVHGSLYFFPFKTFIQAFIISIFVLKIFYMVRVRNSSLLVFSVQIANFETKNQGP